MRTRFEDALFIQEGACNPIAIAGTIHKHMLEMRQSGADHDTIKHDSAIRLMLHQLAFLCQVPAMDHSEVCDKHNQPGHDWFTCPSCHFYERFNYRRAMDDCRSEVKAANDAHMAAIEAAMEARQ